MISDLNTNLILMERYKLSPDELFSLQLMLLAVEEDYLEPLVRFCSISDNHKQIFRNCLNALQEKGIILKSYTIPKEGDIFDPYDVPINKNIIKFFFKESFQLGEELKNSYPLFTTIDGNPVNIRTVAKKFDSLEDCYRAYGRAIGYNPETHDKIIKLLEWAKENNIIKESLASFVINRTWEALEVLKNGDSLNIDFNAIRQL